MAAPIRRPPCLIRSFVRVLRAWSIRTGFAPADDSQTPLKTQPNWEEGDALRYPFLYDPDAEDEDDLEELALQERDPPSVERHVG